eukprot:TRINITY_DN4793_c0_g1_i2.p1 TRINITY_DN4793_c0_g1~~TRINITY_DN4793_c0_g1_i2.p1  ORF type:complete len:398 (+),score=35.59 TRINITY_DN4793_c0_g1_i2:173-1195(+)
MPDDSIAIMLGQRKLYMTNDIPYTFRQNSDFLYLTGFQEPDALLVLRKFDKNNTKFYLYVPERNEHNELWNGPSCGPERAVEIFGADEAFPANNDHLRNVNQMMKSTSKAFIDSNFTQLVERHRLIKSPSEIQVMQHAADISAQAYIEIMRELKNRKGDGEHGLTNHFRYECTRRGAQRLGYPPVVACGSRANTIHYISNDLPLNDGELVLMDAGCEYGGYNSDITRSFPVSGKFSSGQRKVYEALLDVQRKCINLSVIGSSFSKIQEYTVKSLTQCCKELGLPLGKQGIWRYYPHAIGHWLGMDIHDTVSVREVPLRAGMVITIEPGLYIPDAPDIPVR